MKVLKTIALSLVLMAACARAVEATDVTFYVGAINPGDIKSITQRLPLDGSAVFGARVSTSFVPFLGLEHTFAYSPDFLAPGSETEVRSVRGFIYNTNLIVNLPLGTFVPYATAGLGIVWQYGAENLPVGAKFAFNYGGGVKWRLFGPAGVRLDLRGYRTTKVHDASLNIFEVSGGVFVSF